MINLIGPTKDLVIVGLGKSELDRYVEKYASGRKSVGGAEPERGTYYRSDHFEFAKVGVPALYSIGGYNHVKQGEGYGLAASNDYISNHYHYHYHRPSDPPTLRPSDEYDPNWVEGDEFRPVRDKSRGLITSEALDGRH